MTRAYAIGDIHGHLDLLHLAHARIAHDIARHGAAPIIHLGDLVDRGPDSKGVIDHLAQGVAAGKWQVLRGNHDRMFANFLDDPNRRDPGLREGLSYLHPKIGGGPTLSSYGVPNAADRPVAPVHAEAIAKVPADHRAFLAAMPNYITLGTGLIFVHAGIRPGIPMPEQTEDDLVWIRQDWLDNFDDHGALVIHGHTALPRPTHYGNRVNIDSSAAYGGPLSAVVIEDHEVFVLTDQGRERLFPTPDAPIR